MTIDPDFAALAADPRNTVRPLPAHVPLDRARHAANAAMTDPDPPPVGRVADARLAGVPVRLYRPAATGRLPVIVVVHGGGFVWGSLDTHDGICRRLALNSRAAVVSVGYRLAPEARFPAARDDVVAVVGAIGDAPPDWAVDPGRVALCGDSAGGHIALTAALALRAPVQRLRHLSLIYPALDPACSSPSHARQAEGPILSQAGMRWFWTAYLGEDPAAGSDPGDADLSGLPPMTVVTAGLDPLCDEGETLVRRVTEHGGRVLHRRHDAAPHGFLSLNPDARASRDCLDLIASSAADALR